MPPRLCCLALVSYLLALPLTSLAEESTRLPHIPFGETTTCWPERFVLRTDLPIMPTEAVVHRVVHPLVERKPLLMKIFRALPLADTEENRAALEKLERTPESEMALETPERLPGSEMEKIEVRPEHTRLYATVGGWEVHVSTNGCFSASRAYTRRPINEQWLLAPSEDDARAAADAFLELFRPFLQERVNFSNVIDSMVSDGDVIARGVRYGVDDATYGFPVLMGKVYINVTAGPTVTGIRSSIPATEVDRIVPILTPEEAMQHVLAPQESRSVQIFNLKRSATAYIDSIALEYWFASRMREWNPPIGPDYLIPVYIFKGEAVPDYDREPFGRLSEDTTWRAVVEAVRPEYLEE